MAAEYTILREKKTADRTDQIIKDETVVLVRLGPNRFGNEKTLVIARWNTGDQTEYVKQWTTLVRANQTKSRTFRVPPNVYDQIAAATTNH